MGDTTQAVTLKKELGLFSVFALATGATLSSGLFLLPGLAVEKAGAAMILSYLIAALPLIPAMFSMIELATALPRAGGAYYFLDRSMGPLVGTIGGLGTWLALMLKAAFALIGMGAYIKLYVPQMPIVPAAAVLAILFTGANLLGARKAGTVQVALVSGLLVILLWFLGAGLPRIEAASFAGFLGTDLQSILSTAGLVYISYVGITKVASVAEEVKDPERNLPLGMGLAMLTAIVIYGLGTLVMVGVVSPDRLAGDLTPVATCAAIIAGPWGRGAVTIAALFAFSSVANAAVMSASRYPLAMSRDHLLPRFFRRINARGTPSIATYTTLGVILFVLFALDPIGIAKLASGFQLLLFGMICLAVIVMRESGLESYDSGYRSPLYPWMQLAGIGIAAWLMLEMGELPMLFAFGLLGFGAAWYYYYARARTVRRGAIYHIFERLGRSRSTGIDRELRGFLKERGLRETDPYDEVIAAAPVVDLLEETTFEELTAQASELLARRLPVDAEVLAEGFLQGTRVGLTPVSRGAALPHVRVSGLYHPVVVLARCVGGVRIRAEVPEYQTALDHVAQAVVFLASPEEDATQHLRILAHLARQIDRDDFISEWISARDEVEIKETLLRDERLLVVMVAKGSRTESLVGTALRDFHHPRGSLVALIRRGDRSIVPDGGTVLEEGDRITLIGEPRSIRLLSERYHEDVSPAAQAGEDPADA